MAFSPPPGKYEVFYIKNPQLINLDFVNEGYTYFEEIHEADCYNYCASTQRHYRMGYGYIQDMFPSLIDGDVSSGEVPMYLVRCSNMPFDEEDTEEMRSEWVAIVVGPIDLRKPKWAEFLDGWRDYNFGSVDTRKKEGKEFKLV